MEALILELNMPGLHQYRSVDGEVTTIGRALDNDIILSDPTVAAHHLRIVRHQNGSLEIINLSDINPARIQHQVQDSLTTDELPVALEIGRVRARILPRDYAVPATRPLAANRSNRHPFGHVYWAVILVILCLGLGALDFVIGSYNSYRWSDLFKYVLRETVLTIGLMVLALSILERLLVQRWEIRLLVTSVSLIYLLYYLVLGMADMLGYLFSASWPITLFHFGWFLLALPAAISFYLIQVSHLQPRRSIILALLIVSPIAVPAILRSPELLNLLDDFSSSARYQNSLSWLNWHLQDSLSVDDFVARAKNLQPGEFAD